MTKRAQAADVDAAKAAEEKAAKELHEACRTIPVQQSGTIVDGERVDEVAEHLIHGTALPEAVIDQAPDTDADNTEDENVSGTQ